MKAIIHIDESGPFDEKLTGAASSVVGGVCSLHTAAEWENLHREHLQARNANTTARFIYPTHYHCGPLLSRKVEVPVHASDRDLRDFAESVFHNVLDHSLFGFASKNRGKRFEYSPQATYVMNLVAALRCAFERLQSLEGCDVEEVTVVVAQRTIDETAKATAGSRYMTSLLSYVADQLLVGDGPGVALARQLTGKQALVFNSGVGERDAGLIAADFVCCLFRQGPKISSGTTLHVCQPNQEMLLGDYRRFHERLANELLHNRYYGSCLEFLCRFFPLLHGSPDLGMLLGQFAIEEDRSVLEREVPALLTVVHQLAKNRNEAQNLLSCATAVAEKLVAVAEHHTAGAPPGGTQQIWLNLEVQALAELATCHNHTGAVGPQKEVEAKLTALLAQHKGGSGLDALQRQTFILDVRNRNINLLFNDFRFEDAYSLAEELATARRAMVGGAEPDELLGQMLGSLGQACAFMGRQDPNWNAEAIALFEESLKHFAPGSRQEQMSRNFLVTVFWQDRQFREALHRLPEVPGWPNAGDESLECLSRRLLLPEAQKRAFDVVNCLRIAAGLAQEGVAATTLATTMESLEVLARKIGTDHPYEQWWKWSGVLRLYAGDADAADHCFAEALSICGRQSFTMKAIGASVLLLRIVVAAMRGVQPQIDDAQQVYVQVLAELRRQSIGYDAFVSSGSLCNLDEIAASARPGSETFWSLCTYLPFAYS